MEQAEQGWRVSDMGIQRTNIPRVFRLWTEVKVSITDGVPVTKGPHAPSPTGITGGLLCAMYFLNGNFNTLPVFKGSLLVGR